MISFHIFLQLIGEEAVQVYCSPYRRTRQTLDAMFKCGLGENERVIIREEPRLTEQQFGNFQVLENMRKYKEERNAFGRFYYRFPNGESGLDVYSRVSSFVGTLFREFAKQDNIENSNVIIVTHGLTLRLFLMRWFQYTVEEFEQTRNPGNCDVVIMSRRTCLATPPLLRSSSSFYDAPEEGCPENSYQRVLYSLDELSKERMNLPSSM